MKLRLIRLTVALMIIVSFSVVSIAQAGQVSGYSKKNGTYVAPHSRTNPDHNPYNNYSYPGNYNPNKGKITKGNANKYVERYYSRTSKRNKTYGLPRSKKRY